MVDLYLDEQNLLLGAWIDSYKDLELTLHTLLAMHVMRHFLAKLTNPFLKKLEYYVGGGLGNEKQVIGASW